MSRAPIPTCYFALVIVRDEEGRFLLVHERKHGQLWFFPAGRVEPDETLSAGALRETLEEAGIHVELTGIYRVEHTPRGGNARVRVFYAARPLDDTPPKSVADEESLEAAWFRLEDLQSLPLRGAEVSRILHEVAQGAPAYPLSLIASEGTPLL